MPDCKTKHYWKRTIKGNALGRALFSAPFSRRTAEMNASPKWLEIECRFEISKEVCCSV